MLMAGKRALVIGYGDVGKGSAQSLRQEGMVVRVTEVDPICAMQACMDGFEVVSPYINGVNDGSLDCIDTRLMNSTDLIVTCTGNVNVCDEQLLRTVAKHAIVCNIGHFDTKLTLNSCAIIGVGKRLNLKSTKSIEAMIKTISLSFCLKAPRQFG